MISLDRLCDFYVGMFTLCFFVSIFQTLSSVLVLSSWFGVYEIIRGNLITAICIFMERSLEWG